MNALLIAYRFKLQLLLSLHLYCPTMCCLKWQDRGKDEEDEETKPTLLYLLVQDIELSSSSLDQNTATITYKCTTIKALALDLIDHIN
ncbi:hypothetical protein FRX31_031468 [Thalictrum thalictroides]|uniref:Uncharacterized protein n=1 Tax=Thalictrum thalictroides TaxID=46969 RepID=A0A7J6V3D0_THATH|nr:hypothetical protein FRX31_031468 [Thalictrum thalictroides]